MFIPPERAAKARDLTSWQKRPHTIAAALLLIGAAFGSGVRSTEYPAVAWAALLLLFAYATIVIRRNWTERQLDYEQANALYEIECRRLRIELADAHAALETAPGEADALRKIAVAATRRADTYEQANIVLGRTNVELRAQLERLAYTGRTERITEAAA
jgi:hypothetical protein